MWFCRFCVQNRPEPKTQKYWGRETLWRCVHQLSLLSPNILCCPWLSSNVLECPLLRFFTVVVVYQLSLWTFGTFCWRRLSLSIYVAFTDSLSAVNFVGGELDPTLSPGYRQTWWSVLWCLRGDSLTSSPSSTQTSFQQEIPLRGPPTSETTSRAELWSTLRILFHSRRLFFIRLKQNCDSRRKTDTRGENSGSNKRVKV